MKLIGSQIIMGGGRVAVSIVGVITTALIARMLGVDLYGRLAIVLSVGGIFGSFFNLGIVTGTTTEVAQNLNNRDNLNQIITLSFVIQILLLLPFLIILFFFSGIIANQIYNKPYLEELLVLLAPVVFFSLIAQNFGGIMLGMQKYFKYVFIDQIRSVLRLPIILIFIYYYKLKGYFFGELACFVVISVIYFFILKKEGVTFNLPNLRKAKLIYKKILNISFVVFVNKILQGTWNKLPVLLSGYFFDNSVSAIFDLSLRLSNRMGGLLGVATQVNIAYLGKQLKENIKQYTKDVISNFKVFNIIVLLAYSFVITFQEIIVKILFGKNFMDMSKIFSVFLLASLLINIKTYLGSSILFPSYKTKGMIKFSFISFSLSGLLIYCCFYFGFSFQLISISYLIGALLLTIQFFWLSNNINQIKLHKSVDYMLFIIVLSTSMILGQIGSNLVKVCGYLVAVSLIYFRNAETANKIIKKAWVKVRK